MSGRGEPACRVRRLAKRLGVEQPSLYYHFKTRKDLLAAMAGAAMAPHAHAPLPKPEDDWRGWFLDNSRSFRRTLLMRRDGARLHAGSTPTGDRWWARSGQRTARRTGRHQPRPARRAADGRSELYRPRRSGRRTAPARSHGARRVPRTDSRTGATGSRDGDAPAVRRRNMAEGGRGGGPPAPGPPPTPPPARAPPGGRGRNRPP
ncbi:TetR family transcriptional regulator, partial [Streptomyces sp. NPDC090133]|uniref:TetR family transcriptional regulator n=1 Tax=Streptomyces sp. NPDC090133 TaxID=3365956 RepID=UPI00381A0C1B